MEHKRPQTYSRDNGANFSMVSCICSTRSIRSRDPPTHRCVHAFAFLEQNTKQKVSELKIVQLVIKLIADVGEKARNPFAMGALVG